MKFKFYFILLVVLFILSCSQSPNNPNGEPDSPTNLELSQYNNDGIMLSWQDNSNNEDGFSIDRKIEGLAWENDHLFVGEDVETCIDTNLTIYGRYDYRIKAVNGDEVSGYAATYLTLIDYDTLATPTDFISAQLNASKIQLSWNDNSSQEDGFRLDRKIGEENWEEDYAIIPTNNETFIDSNLTVYDLYSYRLFAFIGQSFSDPVEASLIFINSDSLAAPSNLVLEQPDVYSLELTWQDNSTDEEGFRIDRKIGENSWEENYQILDADETSFTDEDLVTIDTYSYRVFAFQGNIYTDFTEAEINFFYYDVSSIDVEVEYEQPYPGIQDITLTATLLDENLNIVEREYPVWFRIVQGPEGLNINNILFGTEDSLAVQSEDGQAVVSLNPGMESGLAAVEVFVFNSENDRISIITSNIFINVAQPPANIQLVIGGIDSGLNVGNGEWEIEAAAIVNDANGNPVSYGTAVWFSIEDPLNPGTTPDWASIISEAYTGNENIMGDSIPGVAYTRLTYEGIHTNDELIIQVQVSGVSTLIDTATVVLPIQFANISVIATPSHVDWTWSVPQNPNPPPLGSDSLSTTIRVQVLDGQNNPINNQTIYFTSSHGMPVPSIPGGDPYVGWTGNIGGQNGLLHKEIYFQYYECAPPIPTPPGTTQVTIEAIIFGTSVSEQTGVTLNRYID
ncbi:MAG: hypothetical protein Q7J16_08670 [Candidatus Cloacimonadales bacterium]|nr:hypothetical protein [Candidatus Cloacimonadales bacterium]